MIQNVSAFQILSLEQQSQQEVTNAAMPFSGGVGDGSAGFRRNSGSGSVRTRTLNKSTPQEGSGRF